MRRLQQLLARARRVCPAVLDSAGGSLAEELLERLEGDAWGTGDVSREVEADMRVALVALERGQGPPGSLRGAVPRVPGFLRGPYARPAMVNPGRPPPTPPPPGDFGAPPG